MNIKIPAAIVLSFGVAWILASGSTPSSAATKPTPCPVVAAALPIASSGAAKVGQTVSDSKYKLSVLSVERGKTYGSFSKPRDSKANEFIAVELVIESLTDKGIYSGMGFAKVRDSDGFEYNSTLFGKDPTLKDQNDLPAGQKRRGWITFEIPKTAKGIVLSYDIIVGSETVEVLLDK